MKVIYYIAHFLSGCYFTLILNNPSRIALKLRGRFLQTRCRIDTGVMITNPENFIAGARSALYHGTYILNHDGQFTLGDHSHLGARCYVNVGKGRLSIGNNVAIGPHTNIITYSNHYREGQKVTEEYLQEDVFIGNNVFIGAHCTILPGSVIEDNTVVGAGSVVKGTLMGYAVYAGTPCRKIRDGWAG